MIVDPCTLYGMYGCARFDDLTACLHEYLDHYMAGLVASAPVTLESRQAAIRDFHQRFKDDIRRRDEARAMTSRFIGKGKTRRIFYEVLT